MPKLRDRLRSMEGRLGRSREPKAPRDMSYGELISHISRACVQLCEEAGGPSQARVHLLAECSEAVDLFDRWRSGTRLDLSAGPLKTVRMSCVVF